MTTEPDYAGLIESLDHRASTMNGAEPVGAGEGHTYVTGYYTVSDRMLDREAATALEAQAAELAAVKEMYAREGAKALYELERAEAAEAKLAEAMKVIEPFAKAGELFPDVSPNEIAYDPCVYLPAAGDEYALTGSHLRAAREFLKENGNGE